MRGNLIFGRNKEIKKIENIVNSNFETGNKPILIYLQGEKGIGKTTILKEIEKRNKNIKWIWFFPDSERNKGFDAIANFLFGYFKLNHTAKINDNLTAFRKIFQETVQACSNSEIKKELIRTESFLAALLDLFWENSLFAKVEPKLRLENTLQALKSFFSCLALQNKLVFAIDNAEWLDEFSIRFWKFLFQNPKNISFVLFAVHTKNIDYSIVPNKRISLQKLPEKPALDFISHLFSKRQINPQKISMEDRLFIYDFANGNPFFIEQTVNHILQNKLINKTGKINTEKLSFQHDKIIRHSISLLDDSLREISKKASVLGNRFTVRILNSMMPNEKTDSILRKGENNNLWFSIDDFEHSFSNSTIRKSIYYSMMKEELIQLHRLAAESIEKIYRENLTPYYGDLAENFLKAEDKNKAIYYLQKAGNYAKELYQNSVSLKYFRQLRELILKEKKYEILAERTAMDIIELLLLINETQTAEEEIEKFRVYNFKENITYERYLYLTARLYSLTENYRKLRTYSKEIINKIKDKFYFYQMKLFYLDSLRFLNDFDTFEYEANRLLGKLKSENLVNLEYKLRNSIGIYCLQRNKYQDAKELFAANYERAKNNKNKMQEQQSLNHLGVTYSRLGERRKAVVFYQKALSIAEEIGNLNALSKIYSNLATIYSIEGNNRDALEYNKKALDLSRSIGNKFQEEIVLYNIAEVYMKKQEYDISLEYLKKSKRICYEISDKIGITYANEMFGDILFAMGKIEEAKRIYLENLKIQTELNEREGIAHAYGNLGNVAKKEKNYDKAKIYYLKQQKILSEIGDKEGEGKAWFNWGTIEMEKNNFPEALKLMKNAYSLFEKSSYSEGKKLARQQIEIINKHLAQDSTFLINND